MQTPNIFDLRERKCAGVLLEISKRVRNRWTSLKFQLTLSAVATIANFRPGFRAVRERYYKPQR